MDAGQASRSRPAKSSNKKAAGHKQGRASGSSNGAADAATKATAPASRRNLSKFVKNDQNLVMSDAYEVGRTPFDNRGEFPQATVDAMHRKRRSAKRKGFVEEEARISSR
jgi:hypothetical protein